MSRFAGRAANVTAIAILVALGCTAAAAVVILGPLGLVSLDRDTPTWGADVFRARMTAPQSRETQAAGDAERQSAAHRLRFWRRYGLALAVAGICGLAWQYWGAS